MLRCTFCNEHFDADEGAPCPRCGAKDTVPLPEPPPSKLVIEFAAPSSTNFILSMEGVVAVGQLEALAHDLLAQAQYIRWSQIHQAVMEQAMQQTGEPKIAVPGLHSHQVGEILRRAKGGG